MRRSTVATALVAVTAGLVATAALRRLARRRLLTAVTTAAVPAVPAVRPAPVADREAVVLPFDRSGAAEPAPERRGAPARCGDSGGRTKSGAPCGALALAGGRCHHHRVAA